MNYVLVAIGAAIGGVLRYAISQITSPNGGFPWTTLGINVVGSFLLGIVIALASRQMMTEEMRVLLAIGFCGGFTTFSTFSAETLALAKARQYLEAISYIASSNILGICGVYIGLRLGGN